jgi:hypothetical protein
MGDRGNLYITNRDSTGKLESWIDLYWHWHGSKVRDYAAYALEVCRGRWDDESYMVALFLGHLYGFHVPPSGIVINGFDDNEHDVVEMCMTDNRVRIWNGYDHGDLNTLADVSKAKESLPFHEFCRKYEPPKEE